MPAPRHCRDSPDHGDTIPRSRRGRDASDHADTMPCPRRGRDGANRRDANRRSYRDRNCVDYMETTRRSNHGRGRSGSSSGSDRAHLPRKRSRIRHGSLAPLRGYCKVSELRKAEEEKRITALKLTKALEAEKEYRKTITDLVNKNRSLRVRNRSVSTDLTRVKHELALDQERTASLTEARNYEQAKLEQQLSVALESTATLQYWINELAQRSRNVELIDHRVRRSKSVCRENATGLDDLSEQSSLSTDDDLRVGSASMTVMPSQPRNLPEGVKELVRGTNDVSEEMSTHDKSESHGNCDKDPGAEKDAEQQLPVENSIDVGVDRSSMPSPCAEPRVFGVGDELSKQSFQ